MLPQILQYEDLHVNPTPVKDLNQSLCYPFILFLSIFFCHETIEDEPVSSVPHSMESFLPVTKKTVPAVFERNSKNAYRVLFF